MASFSGRFHTFFKYNMPNKCTCKQIITSIGAPPKFILKPPPELSNDLLIELNKMMPNFDFDSIQKCNNNNNNTNITEKEEESLVVARSLIFIILFIIVVLSIILVFFILIILTFVRRNRNKLTKTKKEQNFAGHSYIFSNSSSLDHQNSKNSLMQFDPIQKNEKQTTQRDNIFCQKYNSELTSNLSSNSTTSSSTSPNSNLNSSFVNEMEFVSQTNSKSTFKLTNASASSTSSSFLSESNSFLTNNSQHMLLPSRNQRQINLSDSNNQNQYESITDLASQYYFDIDDPVLRNNMILSRSPQILCPDKYLLAQQCQCNSQHSADCFLSIQQQINTFNRINNINNSQDNYLNSLIV